MSRPSSGPLLVAIDAGTTGARAAAIDLDGRMVAEVRRAYRTRVPHPGWAEQDPPDWAENSVAALGGLVRRIRERDRIAGIGLTGQCPTVAPFDARGRPTGPGLLYRDNRATLEAEAMRERLGVEPMHRRTGHTAEAFHVGPKVLWLRTNEAEAFARTALFLQPRDVVLRRLTGVVATDESHANATLFFDLRERRWARDLFEAFDLDPSLFPEALPPWATAGKLSPSVASQVGLSRVPVVIGAGDSQCVAFGAGVTDPGPVSEMAGSSSCFNSAVLEPVRDVRVTHYSHVVPDRYTTELGANTTGAAMDWAVTLLGYGGHAALAEDAAAFRRRWRRTRGRGVSDRDHREAAPMFLPFLGDGERDDPGLRSAFVGLSARHDRAALAYSVVEGVAFAVRAKFDILKAAGCPVDELRAGGGGARLAVLGAVKADVMDCPVLHLDADAAAIGTALLAAQAAGLDADPRATVAKVLARATRFDPDPWGREVAAVRSAWFDAVTAERAVRMPGEATG